MFILQYSYFNIQELNVSFPLEIAKSQKKWNLKLYNNLWLLWTPIRMKLKMKGMPKLFTFCFLPLKNRMKRLNSSKQRSRSFEMKSTYSKVNKTNLRFMALKRMKVFSPY